MELILSFDVSAEPARVVYARVTGSGVEVLESRTFSRDALLLAAPPPATPTGAADGSNSAGELVVESPHSERGELISFIKSVQPFVQHTCIVAPQEDGFFLNLRLPFKDKKTINRVVPLEVQDAVPFELSEFILNSVAVNGLDSALTDIHVAALPKSIIRHSLETCAKLQLEPALITTPASALGALARFVDKSADVVIAYENGLSLYLCLIHRGVPLNQRYIELSHKDFVTQTEELKLALRSFEKTHNFLIQEIISIQGNRLTPSVAKELDLTLRELSPRAAFSLTDPENLLASCAAYYVSEDAPASLSNFRTGEFAYNRYAKEALAAGKKILPALGILFLVSLLCVAGTLMSREFKLHKVQQSISTAIRSAVPSLSSTPPGQELFALTSEINRLDSQIKDLGSPASVNVLEALREFSQIAQTISDIQIQRIRINGNTFRVEGRSPYATIDDLENKLKRHRGSFERVVPEQAAFSSSNAGGDNRSSFAFKIILKE